MDCVNRDMRVIGTTKDVVPDRNGWRRMCCVCRNDTTIKCERVEEEE